MIKKYKDKLALLGLNYKKEILIVAILDVVLIGACIAITLLTKQWLIIIGFVLIIALLDYWYLTRYKGIARNRKKSLLQEFVSIFSFFKVYVKNGYNVYSALKEISSFASPDLAEKMQRLFDDIDSDKSVVPFVSFAANFEDIAVEQLMISVFQMIDEGNESSYLAQFDVIFAKLSSENAKSVLDKKEKMLGLTTMFPLIGAAVLIVMITIGVIAVIGQMINGI